MIIRQACSRHGRSTIHASSKFLGSRQYATEISLSEASKMLESIEKRAQDLEKSQKILQAEIFAKLSERLSAAFNLPEQSTPSVSQSTTTADEQFTSKRAYDKKQLKLSQLAKMGSSLQIVYDPRLAFKHPPRASELTLPMLMAAQTHLGHATSLWNPRNSSYIFGIRDGIHIISLDTTYAYLCRAAKVVQEVARRGGIILFIGTRDKQEEIVVKAAQMAGGYHIFDRWVPGSLTNGQQILGHCRLKVVDAEDKELPDFTALLGGPSGHPVLKPDLVVCFNPIENEVCLHECGLHTVPSIGVIDTDADASWVTYPIPANDDSIRSLTLIAGVLGNAGAEGQQQRKKAAKTGRVPYNPKMIQTMLDDLRETTTSQTDAREGGRK